MRDIVDLLRDWAAHPEYRNDGAERCLRAAEEIERLRAAVNSHDALLARVAALEAALDQIGKYSWGTRDDLAAFALSDMQKIARAALAKDA